MLYTKRHMPYQYKREPLTPDEANRLAAACQTYQERLIVWTLLDTGLRVAELANLTREHIDWQQHRLMIYGKGGDPTAPGQSAASFPFPNASSHSLTRTLPYTTPLAWRQELYNAL